MLGIFPAFTPPTGGIQVSGKIAWSGVIAQAVRWNAQPLLFLYGGDTAEPFHGERVIVSHNKSAAILTALQTRWHAQCVLLWHISFLKFLPFFRLPCARTVVFLHGIEAWQRHDWLTRRLLRRVDLFLSNSAYTWQRFVSSHSSLTAASHRVVHLGIGTVLAEEYVPPGEVPAILMLSRLYRSEDYKGHREMIAIWPRILEQIPNAELWIAGQGDLQADLEAMVRALSLTHCVRFFGWVTDEQKTDLLQRCWGFALPSRAEGFGLVYLEAMRMGRPCLVSPFDAGREIVNPPEAGLNADPRDSRAVADAVCRLLTPGQEWKDWSVRARRRYERHFTAVHFQQRLVEAIWSTPGKSST